VQGTAQTRCSHLITRPSLPTIYLELVQPIKRVQNQVLTLIENKCR
jgi:hypothetical protein